MEEKGKPHYDDRILGLGEKGKPHYDDRVPHRFVGDCRTGMGKGRICKKSSVVTLAAAELLP